MRVNQVKFTDDQLVISGKKAPLIIRLMVSLILVVCALVPLISIFNMVTNGEGLKLGVFVIILLFGAPGFFLLRVFLWNNYGKEVLYFHVDRVDYEADYGWFKDGKNTIATKQLTLDFKGRNHTDETIGTLLFAGPDAEIQTVLPISKAAFDEIRMYCTRYQDKQEG